MKLSPKDREWYDKVLRAIAAAGAGPSDEDLAEAPILTEWAAAVSRRGHVTLLGVVTGHPRLGTASITTSQVIAVDTNLVWARTASRWYRLGRSVSETEREAGKSSKGAKAAAYAMRIAQAGFRMVDDRVVVEQLLAAYARKVREIDAADRIASEVEE